MDCEDLSDEIIAAAECMTNETLPTTSKERYTKTYDVFQQWKQSNNVKSTSETVLKAYFHQLAENKKPTSLWAYHSMIKTMVKIKENVDISAYHQLNAFLKKKSHGYVPIKAKVFTEVEIHRFIFQADDSAWLDVKVVCIFGLCGALRSDEFTKIKIGDVQDHGGSLYLVQVSDTKTKKDRSFTITGAFHGMVKKYLDLRPLNAPIDRFFLNYQREKCTVQAIGKQKLAKMPRRIAAYLNLTKPDEYTGHTFRRTAATILANTGASIEMVKRLGGWKSTGVAEQYIEDSVEYKRRTGDTIVGSITGITPDLLPSTSTGSRTSTVVTDSHSLAVTDTTREPLPSTSTVSTDDTVSPCDFDSNCSQGYVVTEDDEVDDSMLMELGHQATETRLQDLLTERNFSFSHCKVTINFKN